MTTRRVLTDFALHIGPSESGESCALLRLVGDPWIEPGYVNARGVGDGFDVEIVTPTQRIVLIAVTPRHVQIIREQGLYVIQRASAQQEPEALLLEFRIC
ncbi:MAG: hypothetical protein WC749_00070 [Dehalococcoidia bacterium]|uniref:hypothetical protein n=1 Tax=unclassified Pseudomonas TaxID=196821 RepID=UPI001473D015|nr:MULTISPECIES: hypothetical protein [unclassified Pseudomonas]NMX92429.1 hypothetical protein [Pseudomonas sp. WS 5086]NMY47072.1 hypothetical protein [Pseudomonas sp. WS 5027]